ncbi:DivIVA domain protein [Eubacterium brachy ATCC 33089]|jgi:septum site-determining protein divIVA family protein|nr:DivIVA domain protein [Eubacterium brachy ATCC 33089]
MEVVMITPADIGNKEFSRKVRGYDTEEVDMFLDVITVDLEKLIKENLKLKAQLANVEKSIGTIGDSDITVRETLETAKSIMDDLAVSSEKRAKALVENAEMDAAIIIKDAKMKAEQLADESRELKSTFEKFRRDYGNMLKRYSDEFENMSSDIQIDRLSILLDNGNKINGESESVAEDRESSILKDILERDTLVVDVTRAQDVEEIASEPEIKPTKVVSTTATDDRKTLVNIKYE